jgi:hypothetical protein
LFAIISWFEIIFLTITNIEAFLLQQNFFSVFFYLRQMPVMHNWQGIEQFINLRSSIGFFCYLLKCSAVNGFRELCCKSFARAALAGIYKCLIFKKKIIFCFAQLLHSYFKW